jgi:hypothetical protein
MSFHIEYEYHDELDMELPVVVEHNGNDERIEHATFWTHEAAERYLAEVKTARVPYRHSYCDCDLDYVCEEHQALRNATFANECGYRYLVPTDFDLFARIMDKAIVYTYQWAAYADAMTMKFAHRSSAMGITPAQQVEAEMRLQEAA